MPKEAAQGRAKLRAQSSFGSLASSPGESARPLSLDLLRLIAPYRRRSRFTLRIENLPQGARLSAGRNNGDRSWSLALDELDGLCYLPPAGADGDYVLNVRLVAKEEGDASTIALIELPLRPGVAAPPPESPDSPQAEILLQEITSLKAELAGRDQELGRIHAASQANDQDWRGKLDAALTAAKHEWSSAESARLAAAKADYEREVTAFREFKDHVTAANRLLAEREGEFAALKAELARQREKSEADIQAAKKALAQQTGQDAERRAQSARLLEELKARCDDAEARLVRQRQAAETEIAAAKKALADQGACEAGKQEQAAKALADLTARCGEAEENLSRQRQALETEITTARKAAEQQDAAEAGKEREAAQALQDLQARCEAAEAAVVSAKAAGERAAADNAADDAYVRGLNREIKNLQTILVDREAAIARAEASLEQMRIGEVARPAPAHWQPLPGSFTQSTGDDRGKKSDGHLFRDFLLVFLLVGAGTLLFFVGRPMLSGNWQLPDFVDRFGNLFASASDDQKPAPASPVPAALPKPQILKAIVARDVNLRAQPSVNSAVISRLKQGAEVTILERQGNWVHAEAVIPGQTSRQGWIYGSYLAESGSATHASGR